MEFTLMKLMWALLIGLVAIFVGNLAEEKLNISRIVVAIIFIIAVHTLITPLIFGGV